MLIVVGECLGQDSRCEITRAANNTKIFIDAELYFEYCLGSVAAVTKLRLGKEYATDSWTWPIAQQGCGVDLHTLAAHERLRRVVCEASFSSADRVSSCIPKD
jgi:hypothetical protein